LPLPDADRHEHQREDGDVFDFELPYQRGGKNCTPT